MAERGSHDGTARAPGRESVGETFAASGLSVSDLQVWEMEVIRRLDAQSQIVESLQKKQEIMLKKQEHQEEVRRGQLDCLSERVYEAEKRLQQARERQDEAIDKASATFRRHSMDVEQERENLTCVIRQVNQNFEHLSTEMAQHVANQASIQETGAEILKLSNDVRSLSSTVSQHGLDLQAIYISVQQQQQEVEQVQAVVNTMQRSLTSLHDSFACSSPIKNMSEDFSRQLRELQQQVLHLRERQDSQPNLQHQLAPKSLQPSLQSKKVALLSTGMSGTVSTVAPAVAPSSPPIMATSMAPYAPPVGTPAVLPTLNDLHWGLAPPSVTSRESTAHTPAPQVPSSQTQAPRMHEPSIPGVLGDWESIQDNAPGLVGVTLTGGKLGGELAARARPSYSQESQPMEQDVPGSCLALTMPSVPPSTLPFGQGNRSSRVGNFGGPERPHAHPSMADTYASVLASSGVEVGAEDRSDVDLDDLDEVPTCVFDDRGAEETQFWQSSADFSADDGPGNISTPLVPALTPDPAKVPATNMTRGAGATLKRGFNEWVPFKA